jgi:hypothetical protein
MGDLSSQSFAEVWHGEKFRNFRRALLDGPMPSICRTCTATSTGTHFFRLFAAAMDPRPNWVRADRVELGFRNVGTRTWTQETALRIGISAPRDRPSSWHHPSWINSSRVASMSEAIVRPGEIAHFGFETSAEVGEADETFELVVEGVCWLPNTRFRLERRLYTLEGDLFDLVPVSSSASRLQRSASPPGNAPETSSQARRFSARTPSPDS